MGKLEQMQEISDRGIQDKLSPAKRAIFDEAVKRGMVKTDAKETQPPVQDDIFAAYGITPENSRGTIGRDFGGLVNTKRVIENLPGDIATVGKDIVGIVTNFSQVVDGIKALTTGAYNTVRTGEEDPVIAQVRKAAVEKFGSINKFIEAFEAEPAQTGMLLGGVLGLTGAALRGAGTLTKINSLSNAGKTLTQAGTLVDAPTQVAKAAAKVASIPARSMMESATKLGTTIDKTTRNKFFDAMFKHNIMPVGEGLQKVEGLIKGFNKQIDDLIAVAETGGATISKNDVLVKVADMLGDIWKSGDPAADSARILKTISKYEKAWPGQLTPSQAQQIKQNIYKSVTFDKTPGRIKKPQYTEKSMKEAAKGLKEELEVIPGLENIKHLNAEEGVLIELVKPLTRAMNRIEQQNMVIGLGKAIGAGVGSAVGGKLDSIFGTGGVLATTGAVLGFIVAQPKLQAKFALVLKSAERAAAKAQTGGLAGAATLVASDIREISPTVASQQQDNVSP